MTHTARWEYRAIQARIAPAQDGVIGGVVIFKACSVVEICRTTIFHKLLDITNAHIATAAHLGVIDINTST